MSVMSFNIHYPILMAGLFQGVIGIIGQVCLTCTRIMLVQTSFMPLTS